MWVDSSNVVEAHACSGDSLDLTLCVKCRDLRNLVNGTSVPRAGIQCACYNKFNFVLFKKDTAVNAILKESITRNANYSL